MSTSKGARSTIKGSTLGRKRSNSVSAVDRTRNYGRSPAVDIREGTDVATLVCVELSRALMTRPEVSTGVFFRTVDNSQKAISMSDTTVAITAAILKHIGSDRSSEKLLSRSKTVTSHYKSMNLDDTHTREIFVTMLFCLSPEFVKMVETSVKISLERAELQCETPHAENRLANAYAKLQGMNIMTPEEVDTALLGPAAFVAATATDDRDILPSDSSSAIVPFGRPRVRRRLNFAESDIQSYVTRRKQGTELPFREVFRQAEEPLDVRANTQRAGVGYKPPPRTSRSAQNVMNDLLTTGLAQARNPTITDKYGFEQAPIYSNKPEVFHYLDGDSIAASALVQPPSIYHLDTPQINQAGNVGSDRGGGSIPADEELAARLGISKVYVSAGDLVG